MKIDAVRAVPAPAPVAGAPGQDLRVAQFNVLNLFDPIDDPQRDDEISKPQDYQNKLGKLAVTLRDTLEGADLVALQEVENQRVLDDLMARPELKGLGYRSVFVEGNDKRSIDNAILYRSDRVRLTSSNADTPDAPGHLPADGGSIEPGKLFSRPPLIATFELQGGAQAAEGAREVTLIANHFKSKRGGDKDSEPRRVAQAEYIAGVVDARRAADATANIIVLGDLNSLPGEQPLDVIAKRKDGSVRMHDTPDRLPEADRYSFIFQGRRNLLDHVFVTPELHGAVTKVSIPHINSGQRGDMSDPTTPNHASDHDPVLTTFRIP